MPNHFLGRDLRFPRFGSSRRGGGGGGGVPTPPPAPTLAVLPVTPTARWHPGFSSVVESGGRVVSASDLQGLAAATEGASGVGPVAMTDALGRKFWRFEGAEYCNVATTLAGLNTRSISVFFVGRPHRSRTTNPIFGLGNVAAGTAAGTSAAALDTGVTGGAAFVRAFGRSGALSATADQDLVTGSQLQVLSTCSRMTASGGTRVGVNAKFATAVLQPGLGVTGINGAEIGRYPASPGTSGNWGMFDLYELAVYSPALTDTDAAAVAAALQENYGIAEVEHQLVMVGDSITQQIGDSGRNIAMQITDPGAGYLPANWRCVNVGIAGYTTADLVTVRDTASGWATQILAGQNVAAVMIGKNDTGSGANLTGAQTYAANVAYLNTPTTGVLQRGWTVRWRVPIATGEAISQARLVDLRTLLRDPAFLTDTLTGTGQTYEGKLTLVDTDLITVGGDTVFLDDADSRDPIYYQVDATHPTAAGATVMVSGGDTAARAITFGLS
jgi:lysophospholipase L1-like esterase